MNIKFILNRLASLTCCRRQALNKNAPSSLNSQKAELTAKAGVNDLVGRFREIVSDPLNLAIRRDPRAGFVEDGYIYLHNGLKVPFSGPHAYYGEFSSILSINRGVHEPLEEFVFQETLNRLPASPLMLELGAYWGHYSMWLKMIFPKAQVCLVEPELENLNAGRHNFKVNGLIGEFMQAFVGLNQFEVDNYLTGRGLSKINIVHADVQGYELEMLDGCSNSLTDKIIDYLFISTHSQQLHMDVIERLESLNYRVEVSSDFDHGTTSFDGFIFASSPAVEPVFKGFNPMSRVQIAEAPPALMVDYLSEVVCMSNNNKRAVE